MNLFYCPKCYRDTDIRVTYVDGVWMDKNKRYKMSYCTTCFPKDGSPETISEFYQDDHYDPRSMDDETYRRYNEDMYGRNWSGWLDADDYDCGYSYSTKFYESQKKYRNCGGYPDDSDYPDDCVDDTVNQSAKREESQDTPLPLTIINECGGKPISTAAMLMEIRNVLKYEKHTNYRLSRVSGFKPCASSVQSPTRTVLKDSDRERLCKSLQDVQSVKYYLKQSWEQDTIETSTPGE